MSVTVLNYNGLRFLDDCLGSLAELDYPSDRYEVLLVDNVSGDGSVELAEQGFPNVRIVRNSRNLGFAGGNNVAMRASRADYVVLLNNDTSVDRGWLSNLVEEAERDPGIGACTSKLLFRHNRARLRLETSVFRPSEYGSSDGRELGIKILEARAAQAGEPRAVEYLEGFYGNEPSPSGSFRWSAANSTLGLRVSPGEGAASLRLVVSAPRPGSAAVRLTIRTQDAPRAPDRDGAAGDKPLPYDDGGCAGHDGGCAGHDGGCAGDDRGCSGDDRGCSGQTLGSWELSASPREIEITLPPRLVAEATPVVQNAGTLILRNGSGRDRGAMVKGTQVYQEDDLGQYDRPEEVFAGCGAALLLRKTMLEDVGLFDEDFFMYYEDMDLSWRARRRGWKIVYVPRAMVRHVHAGSSVEWSPLFLYHVERNRLLMLAKNAPLGLAAAEQLRYAAAVALNLGRYARSLALRSPNRSALRGRLGIHLRVLTSLARLLPSTMAKRRQLQRRDVVPSSKLLSWMVEG